MSIPPLVLVVDRPVVIAGKLATIPLNVTVTGWFIGNPDPVMRSGVAVFHETTPEIGVTVIDDTVEVKVADAVLEDVSVTEIVCVVGRNAGTMNVAIIAPEVVNVGGAVVGTVKLSIEKADKPTPVAFAKPEPMTVTIVPTPADEGLTTLMTGAPVFVKAAEAAVIPVAVIV